MGARLDTLDAAMGTRLERPAASARGLDEFQRVMHRGICYRFNESRLALPV